MVLRPASNFFDLLSLVSHFYLTAWGYRTYLCSQNKGGHCTKVSLHVYFRESAWPNAIHNVLILK